MMIELHRLVIHGIIVILFICKLIEIDLKEKLKHLFEILEQKH
jgi:hypothetical protein